MKSVVRLLLTASLIGNLVGLVVLGIRHQSVEPAGPEVGASATLAVENTSSATLVSARALAALSVNRAYDSPFDPGSADLASIKAWLQEEGLPEQVAKTVVDTVSLERHGWFVPRDEETESAAEWSARIGKAAEAAEREVKTSIGLFPYEEAEQDRGFAVRYGSIPREKAVALRELEWTYSESTDEEFLPHVSALLSPEELDDYLHYNSLLALNIQFVLSSIDVEKSEYDALLEAAILRETAANAAPGWDAPGREQRPQREVAARIRTPESAAGFRRVLGERRFLEIISRFDPLASKADAVYQAAGLDETTRADLFMEAFETQYSEMLRNRDTIDAVRAAGSNSDLARSERERTIHVTEKLRDSLIAEAGLTQEQVKVLDELTWGRLLEEMRRTQGYGLRLGVQQSGSKARGW